MKSTIYSLCISVAVMILPSCVKDDLYETSHPAHGTVTVITDWSLKSEEAQLPVSHVLKIGNVRREVIDNTNSFDSLLTPGSHSLTVYNIPEGMSLNGTELSVNPVSNRTGARIEAVPGYLFGSHQEFDIEADLELELTALMKQYTRRLEIDLTVVEGNYTRISSVTAAISGVSGSVDVVSGERSAIPMEVVNTMRQDGNMLSTEFHLVGIVPDERQMLTVNVLFDNGDTAQIHNELNSMLTTFHDHNNVIHISGNLSLPVESGFTAHIDDWVIYDGDNYHAY